MNNQDKVAILLSTYNGARYVADQINSILGQSYDNIELFIRDDNSQDETRMILKNVAKQHANVTFINETEFDNVGVTNSFFELLMKTEADYYMFSDQDDVWLSDKVSKTLSAMKEIDDGKTPCLVHTNLYLVDSKLNKIGENIWGDDVRANFKGLLFTNNVAGCTAMINNTLKEEVRKDLDVTDQMFMHDWWIALIASGYGKTAFVKDQTMLYRQHQGNVVGGMDGIMNRLQRLSKITNELRRSSKILKQAKTFYERHQTDLVNEDRKYLEKYYYVSLKKSSGYNLGVMFTAAPKKSTMSGKLLFTFFMLFMPKKLVNVEA